MTEQRFYEKPLVKIAEYAVEQGFLQSMEFIPGVENSSESASFGADDMSRTFDNEGW